MTDRAPSLFARDDTFLGVCEGIGQDFGFNPNILRVTLAVLLFFNPVLVIGGYLATGLAVAAARWAFPDAPRRAKAVPALPTAPLPASADNDPAEPRTAIAA